MVMSCFLQEFSSVSSRLLKFQATSVSLLKISLILQIFLLYLIFLFLPKLPSKSDKGRQNFVSRRSGKIYWRAIRGEMACGTKFGASG